MAKAPLVLNQLLEVLANQLPAHSANQPRPPICLAPNHPSHHLVHLVQQPSQPLLVVFLVQLLSRGECLALLPPHLPPTPLVLELLDSSNKQEHLGRLQPLSLLPLAGLEQQPQLSPVAFSAQVSAQHLNLKRGDFLEAPLSRQHSLVEAQVLLVPRHHRLTQALVEVCLLLASRTSPALAMSSSTLSMVVTL